MQRSRNYYIKTFKDICKPRKHVCTYMYHIQLTSEKFRWWLENAIYHKLWEFARKVGPVGIRHLSDVQTFPAALNKSTLCMCTIRYSNLLCTMQSFTSFTTKCLAHSRLKKDTENEQSTSRWFKVTFLCPSWRSLKLQKGSLNHPKKVTLLESPGSKSFNYSTYQLFVPLGGTSCQVPLKCPWFSFSPEVEPVRWTSVAPSLWNQQDFHFRYTNKWYHSDSNSNLQLHPKKILYIYIYPPWN